MNKEEFLSKVRHPNYDFANTKFVDLRTPIEVVCLLHGVFSIIPSNMLYKDEGCRLCGFNKMAKTKALTKQEFMKFASKIHHDAYDYSLADYKNNKTKVRIICKRCGEVFEQLPLNHLSGCGCRKCGRLALPSPLGASPDNSV